MHRLRLWFKSHWAEFQHWLYNKRVSFLTNRITANKKKLKALRDSKGIPWTTPPEIIDKLVFKDENTRKLSRAQIENAHDILGDPLFVERTPLVHPIPESATPPIFKVKETKV